MIRQRPVVYGEWGFDRKLPMGKGVMRAVRRPVRHRQDDGRRGRRRRARPGPVPDRPVRAWSASTSARRRRTCERIFDAAEDGDAILFFDEADALFGKRSEVKRRARPLRQHRGRPTCCSAWRSTTAWSILATNLRRTSTRRSCGGCSSRSTSRCPRSPSGCAIWRRHFPPRGAAAAPTSTWRSWPASSRSPAATSATSSSPRAFLAAEERAGRSRMRHLVRATRREFQKMGKMVLESDFERYFDLLRTS